MKAKRAALAIEKAAARAAPQFRRQAPLPPGDEWVDPVGNLTLRALMCGWGQTRRFIDQDGDVVKVYLHMPDQGLREFHITAVKGGAHMFTVSTHLLWRARVHFNADPERLLSNISLGYLTSTA